VSVTDAVTWIASALAAGVVVGLLAVISEVRR
jgi:hypothetical protein